MTVRLPHVCDGPGCIIAPFPDIQDCLKYFSNEFLYWHTLTYIKNLFKGNCFGDSVELWKYHYHFVADYGLTSLDFIEKYQPRKYQSLRRHYEKIQREYKDTGPPEWWGNEIIHASHKLALDQRSSNLMIHPSIDLKKRLLSLQHILGEPA